MSKIDPEQLKPTEEEQEILAVLLAEIKSADNINDRATAVNTYRTFDNSVSSKIKDKAYWLSQTSK